ncbi:shikimate kinase [Candidatus Vidania fulgoroideorum]
MINLIGLPANGKTTIFNFLKKKKLNFLDLDIFIENYFLININSYLLKNRFFFFRNIEKNLFYYIKKNISLGGGSYKNYKNLIKLCKFFSVFIFSIFYLKNRNSIKFFSYKKIYLERNFYYNFISYFFFYNEKF